MIKDPPALTTPTIPNISVPQMKVHGTIRWNTPTLSAIKVGNTRPKALDPLSTESCVSSRQIVLFSKTTVTYSAPCRRRVLD